MKVTEHDDNPVAKRVPLPRGNMEQVACAVDQEGCTRPCCSLRAGAGSLLSLLCMKDFIHILCCGDFQLGAPCVYLVTPSCFLRVDVPLVNLLRAAKPNQYLISLRQGASHLQQCQSRRVTMREASRTPSSPAHLQRLLVWLCCHYLVVSCAASAVAATVDGHGGQARPQGTGENIGCRSDYIMVAETTSFPIGGCYQRTNHHGSDGDASYIKTNTNAKAEGVEGRAAGHTMIDRGVQMVSQRNQQQVNPSVKTILLSGVTCLALYCYIYVQGVHWEVLTSV